MTPLKLIFLFLSIIFAIFLQNAVHSASTKVDAAFAELCTKMNKNLEKEMKEILYAKQVGDEQIKILENNKQKMSHSGVVQKSEFGKYIFAKLQLLEGILAEMNDYRPGFEKIDEYFFDKNAVERFLDEYTAGKGTPFKKFSARNEVSYRLTTGPNREQAANWISETVLGQEREPEVKFIKILADIGTFSLVPEVIRESKFPGLTMAYRELQLSMRKFISQFQQEIVFGQTFIGFNDMDDKIVKYKELIADKIKDADKALQGNSSKRKKEFMSAHDNAEPDKFKKIMMKYEQLNNSCSEMYKELAKIIPELISKKAENKKTTVELKIKILAEKHKKKFAKVLATEKPVNLDLLLPNKLETVDMVHTAYFHKDTPNRPSPANANARFFPPSPNRGEKEKISIFNNIFFKKKNEEEEEEDGNENSEELIQIIGHLLLLPDQWLNVQGKLFGKTGWLRTKIRLNAAMLLLAYERMKKFYDD